MVAPADGLQYGVRMTGIPWRLRGPDGPPSEVQLKYLREAAGFAEENGWMPSMRELATKLGVSPMAVHKVVMRLRGKGLLGRSRLGQLEFTEKGRLALTGSEGTVEW